MPGSKVAPLDRFSACSTEVGSELSCCELAITDSVAIELEERRLLATLWSRRSELAISDSSRRTGCIELISSTSSLEVLRGSELDGTDCKAKLIYTLS